MSGAPHQFHQPCAHGVPAFESEYIIRRKDLVAQGARQSRPQTLEDFAHALISVHQFGIRCWHVVPSLHKILDFVVLDLQRFSQVLHLQPDVDILLFFAEVALHYDDQYATICNTRQAVLTFLLLVSSCSSTLLWAARLMTVYGYNTA